MFFQLNRVLPDSVLQACFNLMKTPFQDYESVAFREGWCLVLCPSSSLVFGLIHKDKRKYSFLQIFLSRKNSKLLNLKMIPMVGNFLTGWDFLISLKPSAFYWRAVLRGDRRLAVRRPCLSFPTRKARMRLHLGKGPTHLRHVRCIRAADPLRSPFQMAAQTQPEPGAARTPARS